MYIRKRLNFPLFLLASINQYSSSMWKCPLEWVLNFWNLETICELSSFSFFFYILIYRKKKHIIAEYDYLLSSQFKYFLQKISLIENLPSKSSSVLHGLGVLEFEYRSCLKCTLLSLPVLFLWKIKFLTVSRCPLCVSGRRTGRDQLVREELLLHWKPSEDGRNLLSLDAAAGFDLALMDRSSFFERFDWTDGSLLSWRFATFSSVGWRTK